MAVDEELAVSDALSLEHTIAATSDGADLTGGAPERTGAGGDERPGSASPSRIGRFVVLETLGAGGMGIVYAAIDPELERKVAVKVLHGRADDSAVLLTEAQATAKLSHPNVVQVYEVGTHLGRIYMAL